MEGERRKNRKSNDVSGAKRRDADFLPPPPGGGGGGGGEILTASALCSVRKGLWAVSTAGTMGLAGEGWE